jgi:arylsulfatase A-like enzyme
MFIALPLLAAEPAKKPNIIVIVADDLGYADIGCHGSKDIPTPHIDSLAKNGVRCTNGYVSGPYCSPTRAGLFTGRYQQRFGHEFNPGPPSNATIEVGLSLAEQTMSQRLKTAGYVTGMVGKWHLGHAEKFNPVSRGFDEFFGFLGGAHSYVQAAQANNPIMRGLKSVDEKEYLTHAFSREAVAFVDRHKSEPFFLYYAFNAVHTPMQALDKYKDRFASISNDKRRTYAAMLSAMDDAIGALLTKLRSEKLEENTLLFFISDNGGPENANASDNGPFRGQKAQTWEGGIHVPYIVQWKAKLPAGKTFDHPVIQLDILPTALAAANATPEGKDNLDGVNLLPYLDSSKTGAPHDALYWRFGAQLAIRMGDYKLVKAPNGGGVVAGQNQGKASLDGAQLYNLAKDIGETTNLADKEPEKFKELAVAWQKWNSELADAKWRPAAAAGKNKKKKK